MLLYDCSQKMTCCCSLLCISCMRSLLTWGTSDHNEESTFSLTVFLSQFLLKLEWQFVRHSGSRSLFTPLWSDDTFDSSKLVCMQQNNKLKLSLSCRTLQQRSHQAIKWIALSVLGCLRHLLSNHLHHTWEPLRFPNPFAFSLPHVRSIIGGYGTFVVNRALSLWYVLASHFVFPPPQFFFFFPSPKLSVNLASSAKYPCLTFDDSDSLGCDRHGSLVGDLQTLSSLRKSQCLNLCSGQAIPLVRPDQFPQKEQGCWWLTCSDIRAVLSLQSPWK